MSRLRRLGLLTVLLVTAGCAERGVVSGPPSSTGTGTWVAVAVAATAVTLVLAALVVLPVWRPGGSAVAAWLLALQAGAAVVGGAVLLGTARRGAALVDRPADAEQAASLVSLTGLDGRDTGFFNLVAVLTVVLGLLLVAVLVLGARFAADTDPVERTLACCILAVESLLAGLAAVALLLGHHSLPLTLTALTLPVTVFATVRCWPRREAAEQEVGYNGGHG